MTSSEAKYGLTDPIGAIDGPGADEKFIAHFNAIDGEIHIIVRRAYEKNTGRKVVLAHLNGLDFAFDAQQVSELCASAQTHADSMLPEDAMYGFFTDTAQALADGLAWMTAKERLN